MEQFPVAKLLLDWAWAIVLLLFTWWHNQNQNKLKELKEELSTKADKEEVLSQHRDLHEIMDRIRSLELSLTEIRTQSVRINRHIEMEEETAREFRSAFQVLLERRNAPR